MGNLKIKFLNLYEHCAGGTPAAGFSLFVLTVLLALGPLTARAQQTDPADLTAQSLEDLLHVRVVSAAMHEQNLTDAPGDVTVITAQEIRQWGYRTLADALSYVRGFYISADHTYTYVGIRGFSLPGDFETRVVVMIDGHNLAENVYDMAAWYGNDFPVDLDVVDRIEIVRGPSSALYGSNGVLATINVVTKRPANSQGTEVRLETGSLGERKVVASESIALGKKANLLFSASIFNNAGFHTLYFPEFDAPETNFGRAIDMDGEKGYHVFADLTWGNWEVLAVAGDRVKTQPISWGNTAFNDRGTRVEDSRGFVEASYTKDLSGDRTLSWRTSYDEYRYRGIYHYVTDSGLDDNRERDYGDWFGSKLSYRLPDWRSGHLTVGAETRIDLRSLQNVRDVWPEQHQILSIDRPDRYAGVFAQQEWTIARRWELNLGGRFDWTWLKKDALSPRAALLYKPSDRHVFKFLYGRGFRNPSNYEMFFDDNGFSARANPSLHPETTNTFEVDTENQLSKRIHLIGSVYHYRLSNLIQQSYTPDGLEQYVNANRVHAAGASFGLDYDLPAGMRVLSTLEIQRAVFGGSKQALPNSPGQVGKLQFSLPLWRNRFTLGTGLQAFGQRQTYAGDTLPWVVLPEAVLSTKNLPGGWQLSAGMKNFSNSFYRIPVGLTSAVDSIEGNGRTYYLNLRWQSATDRETLHADASKSSNGIGH